MAEIELGERLVEPAVVDRPLGRCWLTARWLRLGVVLAMLFATMTAAGTRPMPLTQVTIPARLGALVVTGVDRIFVIDPVDTTMEPRQQVSAFRLPDGAPLWRVRMPVSGPLGGHTLIGDTLVLTSDWGSVAPRRTVGVDIATGAVSWSRTGSFEAATASGDVLLWIPDADIAHPGTPGWNDSPGGWGFLPPGTLQAVAPHSGAVRWSAALPGGVVRSYGGQIDEFPAGWSVAPLPQVAVTPVPSGRIETRDLATGQVVRSAELPRLPAVGSGQWPPQVVGDLLLVPDGRQSVTAYGLDRFDRRWTMQWDVDREPWPVQCGRMLCVFRPQGGVRMLDRDSGAIRWTDPRWSNLLPVGSYLIASNEARPLLAAELAVLDPATGRVLGDLGAWQVVGRSAGTTRLTGVRTGPDGRTRVADLDPASMSARVLAVLPDISGDCRSADGLLVCRRLSGALGIWRLPT